MMINKYFLNWKQYKASPMRSLKQNKKHKKLRSYDHNKFSSLSNQFLINNDQTTHLQSTKVLDKADKLVVFRM